MERGTVSYRVAGIYSMIRLWGLQAMRAVLMSKVIIFIDEHAALYILAEHKGARTTDVLRVLGSRRVYLVKMRMSGYGSGMGIASSFMMIREVRLAHM